MKAIVHRSYGSPDVLKCEEAATPAPGDDETVRAPKRVLHSAKMRKEDLMALRDLIEGGKVTPVIDRRYPLSEAAEAVRYFAGGHVGGKVVVTMAT